MDIKFTQSLQLKQTLQLTQVMVQRFEILQQTAEEFQDALINQGKKNPFLSVRFMDQQPNMPSDLSNSDYVSPIDFATYEESLLSVLTNQLDVQFLSERDYEIVLTLIDEVDEKGFIKNYKDIREVIIEKFNVSKQDVFKCLKVLQSFDPEGIGARSLNECLWIQIQNYDLDDEEDRENLKTMAKDHLEDISENHIEKIKDSLGVSEEKVQTYINFISNLNPNPTSKFSSGESIKIQPSLRIEEEDGVLRLINLEEERISLTLNQDMLKKLSDDSTPDLQKQFNNAKVWLEHFRKRQNLIKHCGELLIQKQRLYFLEGEEYILPYLQLSMAKDMGVSESTVSRLVSSKYIETKHGIILIKSLCKRSVYGKTASQVKSLVKYYCEKYPALSDQKISEILKSIGLPIARRTVTKYRHASEVKSSYQRKLKPK